MSPFWMGAVIGIDIFQPFPFLADAKKQLWSHYNSAVRLNAEVPLSCGDLPRVVLLGAAVSQDSSRPHYSAVRLNAEAPV